MTAWTRFIRTTVIGGVVFLVPFIVIVFVLGKAFQLMSHVAAPLSKVVPLETVGDIAVVNLIAIGLILLLCFLAGLIARTAVADSLVHGLETRVLSHIPIYEFVKGMTSSVVEAEKGEAMTPVLVRLDDYAQLAFEMERTGTGDVVVYLPGAPNPWSGAVCIVSPDRVTPLGASVLAAVQNIKHLGKGTGALV
jgi:uncharacterized membrane protein